MFLLTANLIYLIGRNYDPVLNVKRIDRRKFIDYFGLSIEDNSSRVGKKNLYVFHISYIPGPSLENPHIKRIQMKKELNLEPSKICLYQPTEIVSTEIAPHISSA